MRAGLSRLVEAALWVATAGRGLRAVLPHGEIVRLAPRWRRTCWNLEEYEAFRQATCPGDIVIDAGANTGAYTVLFAQWVGSGGHVYAFEPVPSLARGLREQVGLNGLSTRVTIVEAALGDAAATIAMRAPGAVGINRRAVPSDAPDDRVDVPAVSLDGFCRQHGITPALVKIDVEGAELDVLRGARGVLAASPRARVFVEFHPSLWPAFGLSRADIDEELTSQRLRAEALRQGDDVWRVEGICARLVAG